MYGGADQDSQAWIALGRPPEYLSKHNLLIFKVTFWAVGLY